MMKKKKRGVLILSPFFYPNVGGVETHLIDLCRGLRKRNYFVYVLTYQPIAVSIKGQRVEKERNLYIRRLWWPGFNLFHKLESWPPFFNFVYLTPGLFFLSFFFLLNNQKKIDVIHGHGIVGSFIAVVLKRIFKIPVVVGTHAIYSFKPKSVFARAVKEIFNSTDKVLALAEKSRKELLKIGVSKEKLGRYTYWVNQKIFEPMDKKRARKKLAMNNTFTVLFVGRLMEIKGVRTILQVAKEVENKINFIFIGAGPLEKESKLAAKKHKNIIFCGRVDNQRLPIYFNAADIFVIPSKYPEGFARVVLEALSCGLPVFASNMGVIPEEINQQVGVLMRPTARNFKQKILWAYKNPGRLRKMSKAAVIFARKNYSEKNIEAITRAYEEIAQ